MGEMATTTGIPQDSERRIDNHANDARDEAPPLELDQIFEILKNRRRRKVLHFLEEHEGTATLSELAEHIAALENDTTVRQITSGQRKRVYVGLYQCHLPKMDDMAIVEFEKNRGNVELGPSADLLEPYLSGRTAVSGRPLLYTKLSLAGFVLVGLSSLILPSVFILLVALGTLLTIAAVSVLDTWSE